MLNSLTLTTPFGPFKITGKQMLLAFLCGMAIGAITFYKLQELNGKCKSR